MIFVVERNLPGLGEKHLAALREALGEASRRLSTPAEPVRYIRSTYVIGQPGCQCMFEADSRDAVVRVNETAQVPFVSVRAINEDSK